MTTHDEQAGLILLVEDNRQIAEMVGEFLEMRGYSVDYAADGVSGLHLAVSNSYDVIVLDLMLPGIDGLEVCRKLREAPRTRDLLVIMLTAKGTEADVVVGLTLGADDYIVKPFSTSELMARIKTVLRRAEPREIAGDDEAIKVGPIAVDLRKHEVRIEDQPVELTLSEFKLLGFLIKKKGRVFTRDQLLDAVVGPDVFVTARNIDVHVAALRKKLGKYGGWIVTVRGVGYRFEEV